MVQKKVFRRATALSSVKPRSRLSPYFARVDHKVRRKTALEKGSGRDSLLPLKSDKGAII